MEQRMEKITENKNKELSTEIEKLERQVKILKSRRRYGLTWEEEKEPEQIVLDCQYKIPILKDIKTKAIITDKKMPENILIEGDNYHALSVLNYTHSKAIDLVIIDPPYNTGRNDFKYNDNYVNEEDAYRHSKWLSFMKNRLQLAKNIIKDTGGIFVFIDDNEFAQLKLLMDEVFGKENFKNCMIWAYRTGGAPRKTNIFNPKHDYILFYSKSKGLKFNTNLKERINYKKDFFGAKKDENGNFYALVNLRDIIEGEIELYKDDKPYKIINTKPVINLSVERVEDFASQKPIGLIKFILEIMAYKDNMVICDFFAGTGTVGKAVLTINEENNTHHKFILCTNNENGIAENICYPEIKKYMVGSKKIEALGGNLQYFKTELLDINHISHVSDEQKIRLTYQAGEIIALREDTFEEVEKDEWWQIFKNGQKYTAIYFKEDKSKLNELVNKLSKLNKEVSLYIFSWGKNEYKNEFTEYNNIKVEDIPEPIIDVYKEVNRLS